MDNNENDNQLGKVISIFNKVGRVGTKKKDMSFIDIMNHSKALDKASGEKTDADLETWENIIKRNEALRKKQEQDRENRNNSVKSTYRLK